MITGLIPVLVLGITASVVVAQPPLPECRNVDELYKCAHLMGNGTTCRFWYKAEECAQAANCSRSFISEAKRQFQERNRVTCHGKDTNSTFQCRDVKWLPVCFSKINKTSKLRPCKTWNAMESCMEQAGCSDERIDMADWGFNIIHNINCNGLKQGDVCSSTGDLRDCINRINFHEGICPIWNEVEKCMIKNNCRRDYINVTKTNMELFNQVTCDGSNNTKKYGCRDNQYLIECLIKSNRTSDTCSDLIGSRVCMEEAGCTEATIKVAESMNQVANNVSCPGMEIDNVCKDYRGLSNCILNYNFTTGNSCGYFHHIERCMVQASCEKEYIIATKEGFEQLNITCDGSNNNTKKYGCRDQQHLIECLMKGNRTSDTCSNINSFSVCMEEAGCTEGTIKVAESINQVANNVTCPGMEIDNVCKDYRGLSNCIVKYNSTTGGSCGFFRHTELCMVQARCDEDYIISAREEFERLNITCDDLNNTTKYGCKNWILLRKCMGKLNISSTDTCSLIDAQVMCMREAGCTEKFLKASESHLRVAASDITCPGMDDKIITACDDYREYKKCTQTVNNTNPESCENWWNNEKCMIRARCEREYIDAFKEGMVQVTNLTCDDFNNTKRYGCRDWKHIGICLERTNSTTDVCTILNDAKWCMREAGCTERTISASESHFRMTSNITCPGMDDNIIEVCDYKALTKCAQEVNLTANATTDPCEIWRHSERCMVFANCDQDYIEVTKDLMQEMTNLTCDGSNNTKKYYCRDYSHIIKCVESLNLTTDVCANVNSSRQCMREAGCTEDTINVTVSMNLVVSNITCPGVEIVKVCKDYRRLANCTVNFNFTTGTPCEFFLHASRCMVQAGCDEEFIIETKESLKEMNFTCDGSNNTKKYGCRDWNHIVKCVQTLNDTSDTCAIVNTSRRCMVEAGCTERTIKVSESMVRTALNVTCAGMDDEIIQICDDYRELAKCASSVNLTTSEPCEIWHHSERCMIQAHCDQDYIDATKEQIRQLANLTCDGYVSSKTVWGCQNADLLSNCMTEIEYTPDLCKNWNSQKACMVKANCTKSIIQISESFFREASNVTCDGMDTVSIKVCNDYKRFTDCATKMNVSMDYCNNWNELEKCMVSGGCSKEYMDFSKEQAEQALLAHNITCDWFTK